MVVFAIVVLIVVYLIGLVCWPLGCLKPEDVAYGSEGVIMSNAIKVYVVVVSLALIGGGVYAYLSYKK